MHTYKDYLTFLGEWTLAQIECVALGTDPEPNQGNPAKSGPTTTGSIAEDQHRWVWPPPHGFNFGLDKAAPMFVKVMHSAPGSTALESPWMAPEEVTEWAKENPAQ